MLSIIILLGTLQYGIGSEMEQASHFSSSIETLKLDKGGNVDTILITSILCYGEILVINGTTYDINNPSGIEVVPDENGYDIVYIINLTFFPLATTTILEAVCENDPDIPVGQTVVLIDQYGCDSIVILEVVILPPDDPACLESSITGENTKEQWLCYPNPVTDMLTIEAAGHNDATSFSIITNEGRPIVTGKLNDGRNDIDLKNLSTGHYILRIKSPSGTVYKKLLKM